VSKRLQRRGETAGPFSPQPRFAVQDRLYLWFPHPFGLPESHAGGQLHLRWMLRFEAACGDARLLAFLDRLASEPVLQRWRPGAELQPGACVLMLRRAGATDDDGLAPLRAAVQALGLVLYDGDRDELLLPDGRRWQRPAPVLVPAPEAPGAAFIEPVAMRELEAQWWPRFAAAGWRKGKGGQDIWASCRQGPFDFKLFVKLTHGRLISTLNLDVNTEQESSLEGPQALQWRALLEAAGLRPFGPWQDQVGAMNRDELSCRLQRAEQLPGVAARWGRLFDTLIAWLAPLQQLQDLLPHLGEGRNALFGPLYETPEGSVADRRLSSLPVLLAGRFAQPDFEARARRHLLAVETATRGCQMRPLRKQLQQLGLENLWLPAGQPQRLRVAAPPPPGADYAQAVAGWPVAAAPAPLQRLRDELLAAFAAQADAVWAAEPLLQGGELQLVLRGTEAKHDELRYWPNDAVHQAQAQTLTWARQLGLAVLDEQTQQIQLPSPQAALLYPGGRVALQEGPTPKLARDAVPSSLQRVRFLRAQLRGRLAELGFEPGLHNEVFVRIAPGYRLRLLTEWAYELDWRLSLEPGLARQHGVEPLAFRLDPIRLAERLGAPETALRSFRGWDLSSYRQMVDKLHELQDWLAQAAPPVMAWLDEPARWRALLCDGDEADRPLFKT
jgi:hypothetical protein